MPFGGLLVGVHEGDKLREAHFKGLREERMIRQTYERLQRLRARREGKAGGTVENQPASAGDAVG